MSEFSEATESEKPTLVLVKSESGSESNGKRPPKAKGIAKCGPKPEQETKVSREVKVKASQLRAKADDGDAGAKVALEKIQTAYTFLLSAKERRSEVTRECNERSEAAKASFTNAIEAPLDGRVVEGLAYRAKLEHVEMSWQNWSEVKAHNIEEKKEAGDVLKSAQETLSRAIVESSQLALPGVK